MAEADDEAYEGHHLVSSLPYWLKKDVPVRQLEEEDNGVIGVVLLYIAFP